MRQRRLDLPCLARPSPGTCVAQWISRPHRASAAEDAAESRFARRPLDCAGRGEGVLGWEEGEAEISSSRTSPAVRMKAVRARPGASAGEGRAAAPRHSRSSRKPPPTSGRPSSDKTNKPSGVSRRSRAPLCSATAVGADRFLKNSDAGSPGASLRAGDNSNARRRHVQAPNRFAESGKCSTTIRDPFAPPRGEGARVLRACAAESIEEIHAAVAVGAGRKAVSRTRVSLWDAAELQTDATVCVGNAPGAARRL